MKNHAVFLKCTGTPKANPIFLLEYKKAVLLALQQDGILDPFQLAECVRRLEAQNK